MRSDVAVTHPATRAVVEAQPSTADTPLLAATQTEKKKQRKYSALVQHEGSELLPCVLESCGAWGKQADKLLKMMVRHAPFPDDERQGRLLDARIRVAVALQRRDALVLRSGLLLLNDERDTQVTDYARMVQPHRRVFLW